MKTTLFQFFRFGLVGAGNTALDFFIYFSLTRSTNFFAEHYLAAAAIAFFVAGLNSYIWNKHWTFNDGLRYSYTQLIRFYSVAAIALVINQFCLWLLVENAALNDLIAKLGASMVAGGINFLLQKFWTFPSHVAPIEQTVEDDEENEYTLEEDDEAELLEE